MIELKPEQAVYQQGLEIRIHVKVLDTTDQNLVGNQSLKKIIDTPYLNKQ